MSVLTAPVTNFFLISPPFFGLLILWDNNNTKMRPADNLTVASTFSSERKSQRSLTLNLRLGMLKFSEEGVLKSRPLVPVFQFVNTKNSWRKFKVLLKWTQNHEHRNNKEAEQLSWGHRESLAVWIGDQTNHHIPLSQSLIQSKALTVFTSVRAERGEELHKRKSEAVTVWFMRLKERNDHKSLRRGTKCWGRSRSQFSWSSSYGNLWGWLRSADNSGEAKQPACRRCYLELS